MVLSSLANSVSPKVSHRVESLLFHSFRLFHSREKISWEKKEKSCNCSVEQEQTLFGLQLWNSVRGVGASSVLSFLLSQYLIFTFKVTVMIALEKVWMLLFLYFSPCMFLAAMTASKKPDPTKFATWKLKKNHTHRHRLHFFTYKFLVLKIFNALMIMIFPSLWCFPQQTTVLTVLLLLHFFSTYTNSYCNSLAVGILKERLAVPTTP